MTDTKTIYKETKLLNVQNIYRYNSCILIRKIQSGIIHSQITFRLNNEIIAINTRRAKNIFIPVSRTQTGKKHIAHEGAQIYNDLPKEIKDATSFINFKNKLKSYFQINDS